MVTRPLDLLSKLRRPAVAYDWMYFVNAALIGLYFILFGSRFVLSPGVAIQNGAMSSDIHLPVIPQAVDSAMATSVVISVAARDLVFTDDGKYTFQELERWLRERIRLQKDSRLLVRADSSVTLGDLAEIHASATAAGFTAVQFAAEPTRIAADK